mmetsp:Transcript_27113/g.83266  ORF Transcript_27113/g.83266 Transcript_27113/m.83266 type:complete len:271 (+) Transcript_27113:82-894(+)
MSKRSVPGARRTRSMMASRRRGGSSEGHRMSPPRCSSSRQRRSMAKAAVAMPTAASRSWWVWLATTTSPVGVVSSTRMAFSEPTRASTARTTGSENCAKKAMAGRFARAAVGTRALVAAKSWFQISGAVAKREDDVTVELSAAQTVRTSGQSRSRVRRGPMSPPKSTSREALQASRNTRSPLSSKFKTGVASSKNVAATIVGPAPPVPAVKKSKSIFLAPPCSSASFVARSAEKPGHTPALTTADNPLSRALPLSALTASHSAVSSQTST